MSDKELNWPVLVTHKALEKFSGNPCIDIDLRKFRFRNKKEVTISAFSGLLKTYVKKDDNGSGYGGIMITSDDCQIKIMFNDKQMIDDLITKLNEVKSQSYKKSYTYEMSENIKKENECKLI